MKYDFTSIIDRHGRDSIAVDGLKGDGFSPAPPKEGFDAIPMWVADMNFPTVPTIQQAIIERASHPTFGYFEAPPEYYKKYNKSRQQAITNELLDIIGGSLK